MASALAPPDPARDRPLSPDRAAAELPGLVGHDGQPPSGSVIVAATGPGGGRAVLVRAEHVTDPRVREQTLLALEQVGSDHLLLIGYGLEGDRNALAVDDSIHAAPPGGDDRFWATQVLHADRGRVRDPGGEWRLQPRPTYTSDLTPSEQARLVRSVAVEAAELLAQSIYEQPGGWSEGSFALREAVRLVNSSRLMRDVAIAELIDQEDGVENALALYGAGPGTHPVQPGAAGMVAAVAAARSPSTGILRMTAAEGERDALWLAVYAHASAAAREGRGFPLAHATRAVTQRFTLEGTPGRHWAAAGWEQPGRDPSTPWLSRSTLEQVAEATGRDLTWNEDTATAVIPSSPEAPTIHRKLDDHYLASSWGMGPLQVTTPDALRTIVADVVSETPVPQFLPPSTDLDHFQHATIQQEREVEGIGSLS